MAGSADLRRPLRRSPARSTSSASAGRCSWCASCCSARSASPTCAPGCPGLSPDVLSQRLRELEQARAPAPAQARAAGGLARVRAHRARAGSSSRSVLELGRWGSQTPFPRARRRFSADSFVIALQDAVRPGRRRRASTSRSSCGWARTASGSAWPTGGSRSRGAARSAPTRWSRAGPARSRRCSGAAAPLAEALRDRRRRDRGQHARGQALPRRLPRGGLERGLALARELQRELPEAAARRAVVGLRVRGGDGLAVVEVPGDALELGVEGEADGRRDAVLEPVDRAARSPPAPSWSACRSRGAGC